jgi:hypothetical protein
MASIVSVPRLVLAAALALAIAPAAQAASTRAPVVAKGSCTEVSGRKLVAVFDVRVTGRRAAKVRRGRANRVSGGKVVGKQPTVFRPGTTRRALRVAFARHAKRASWRLGRRTARVARVAKRCDPKHSAAAPPTTPNAWSGAGPAPPPSGAGYCSSPAVTGAWTGRGRTIAATPATLSSAVAGAAAGDTVVLADGVYSRASVTLTKPIRLMAAHPLRAVFVGGPAPRFANDTGLGGHVSVAVRVRASGAMVEGIEVRYYDVGIDLSGVAGVTIQGNRLVSLFGDGVQVWDTRATEVRCNEFLDPYLAQDATASVTTGPNIPEAQMDYGVSVYGSLQPRVEHNYFFGVFNQTLSFKEGNWDPYAGYNTFEGSALTALFFGQNRPDNGPYSFTGLPMDYDRGQLVAEDNVFREVYGARNGAPVVYFLRSPIRVWHVNGATTVRANVIEQAQEGISLECRGGPEAGCDTGTTHVTANLIAGRVRDLTGTIRQVNVTAGALVFSGLQAQATFDGNVFALLGRAIGIYNDRVAGQPSYAYGPNSTLTAAPAGAPMDLRPATATTDPDLSYAAAYR